MPAYANRYEEAASSFAEVRESDRAVLVRQPDSLTLYDAKSWRRAKRGMSERGPLGDRTAAWVELVRVHLGGATAASTVAAACRGLPAARLILVAEAADAGLIDGAEAARMSRAVPA